MDPGVRFPVHTGKRKTSVYSRLEESPGSFAFAQAVDIIRRYLRSLGVEEPDKALRFRVNPNLSFPPGDMESLTFSGRDKLTRAELTLNLMGLHGAGLPPSHVFYRARCPAPGRSRRPAGLFRHFQP